MTKRITLPKWLFDSIDFALWGCEQVYHWCLAGFLFRLHLWLNYMFDICPPKNSIALAFLEQRDFKINKQLQLKLILSKYQIEITKD